ncbi:hypothetical protein F5I97DRAFT_1875129 [Phlebopus sp. FC_14]|nr:hypothetical protein F5I97DRAFT_1875129 [Phlebopus sp. FC_14]
MLFRAILLPFAAVSMMSSVLAAPLTGRTLAVANSTLPANSTDGSGDGCPPAQTVTVTLIVPAGAPTPTISVADNSSMPSMASMPSNASMPTMPPMSSMATMPSMPSMSPSSA